MPTTPAQLCSSPSPVLMKAMRSVGQARLSWVMTVSWRSRSPSTMEMMLSSTPLVSDFFNSLLGLSERRSVENAAHAPELVQAARDAETRFDPDVPFVDFG